MDLKWKYITLYRDNDRFNEELVQFVTEENLTDLVIGQDDAHPYGLPNYNRLNAGAYPQAYDLHPPIYTSQGADELGTLAAARIYSRRTGYRPRIRVLYGDPAMKDYTLHFVPLTLGQIAEERSGWPTALKPFPWRMRISSCTSTAAEKKRKTAPGSPGTSKS